MGAEQNIAAALEAVENFHGVVSFFENGKETSVQARGSALIHAGVANRPDTRFGIASGSKAFTAVTVLRLAEKGLLSLDSPANDFLHPWKVGPGVTIRHLLTHTSGLPDYFDEEVMDDYEELWQDRPCYRFQKPEDFFPLFLNRPAAFEPGARFAYSNGGYVVLGRIIETVTGLPFAQAVEEAVFRPAGMGSTGYFRLDALPVHSALGHLYDADRGTWRTNIYSLPVVGGGDGGCFTTGADMAAFWKGLASGRLLSPGTVGDFWKVQVAETGDDRYGLGVWIDAEDDDVAFLQGFDPGVYFVSFYHKKKEKGFTLFSNGSAGDRGQVFQTARGFLEE